MKTINVDNNKYEQLKKEAEDWKNKYLRALADYQNLEKRVTAVRLEEKKYAAKELILKLLSIFDALEKAESHIKNQGLSIAISMFKNILENEGIKKIEVIGKKFDPVYMECIEKIGDIKDDVVSQEIRPGYLMMEQILRVAQVKVGKDGFKTIIK